MSRCFLEGLGFAVGTVGNQRCSDSGYTVLLGQYHAEVSAIAVVTFLMLKLAWLC